MPDWQLTPEEEVYGDTAVDANGMAPMVDENGMPIGTPPPDQGYPQQQPMVRPDGTGEPEPAGAGPGLPAAAAALQPISATAQPQPQPRQPPPRQPDPLAPADPPQPRPDAA